MNTTLVLLRTFLSICCGITATSVAFADDHRTAAAGQELFNGKDLDAVIELYLDYVKRIVGALRTAEAAIELETLDDVAAPISTSSAEASCATRKRKAHTPALLPDPE